MSFSRYFKLVAIVIAMLVSYSPAAKKSASGKIRNATGPLAQHQPKGKGDFIDAQPNAKVREKDNFRTGDESMIIIALPDGSSLTINERTEAQMEQLLNENGINTNTVNIINGKVNFVTQKQNDGSEFKFKSVSATAAIRGTSGLFGRTGSNRLIASLRTGLLEINDTKWKGPILIKGGQTLIDTLVLDLKSSGIGGFINQIEPLVDNPRLFSDTDKLGRTLRQADSTYQTRLEHFRKSANCTAVPLPDTIYTPNSTLKIKCNKGILVGLQKAPVLSGEETTELDIDWAPNQIGPKKFTLNCYMDSTDYVPCAELTTYYAGPRKIQGPEADVHRPLTITTSSPLEVCDPASATVEGTFDPRDTNATLRITLGKYTSPNLYHLSANGKFSHTIPVNDQNGNWNATQAKVEYSSAVYGSETATLELKVNKTCSNVNSLKPSVEFDSYDSLRCLLYATIQGIDDDNAIYTFSRDRISGKETYLNRNAHVRLALDRGRHVYDLKVTDQAGHSSQISRTLGCYPVINGAKISVKGKIIERLRVPPPPGNIRNSFYRSLQFSVTGLPDGNPDFIRQIVLSQPGKEKTVLQGSDMTDTRFVHPVELSYGTTTRIDITVTLKSGQILRAYKIYEVR